MTNEQLFERAKRVSPGGVHSPVRAFRGVGGAPRFIKQAKGSRLIDVEGNEFIDFCMSWGPLIFGHQDEEIQESIMQALHRGWSFGTAEPYSLELAEFITERIPWIEQIRFVSSGTEAVMSALRVARAATGRSKILKFDGCYHGHSDSMLVKAGSGLAESASPDSAGVPYEVAEQTIVAPLDDLAAFEKIMQLHAKDLAAVIIEPIPANNGLLIQDSTFLQSVVRLAQNLGVLVIFDEVITGFRVSFGGMTEITQLKPDLVTYGKILGGGFPVGAYGGRKDLLELVAPVGPVYQAGTLSANPVAVCAGLAMLKKLVRDDPYAALAAKTEVLAKRISELSQNFPVHVQHFASMFWIIFGEQKIPIRSHHKTPSSQREIFPKIFHKLLRKGIYLPPSAFEVAFLSTAHSKSELDDFFQALQLSLEESC